MFFFTYILEMEIFETHAEYIQYHYNSLSASGRIDEVVDLVKNQKSLKSTDYKFLTDEGVYGLDRYMYFSLISGLNLFLQLFFFEGQVLLRIHGDDLSDQLRCLVQNLCEEKVVAWKQMRIVEFVGAVLAETLLENQVEIYLEPPQIQWPNGNITKVTNAMKKQKGKYGKNVAKNGVAGEIVVKYRLRNASSTAISQPKTGCETEAGPSCTSSNAPNDEPKPKKNTKGKFRAPVKKNCGGGDVEPDEKPLRVGKGTVISEN